MNKKEILEHPENDKIVARILADKIYQKRYEKSVKKICKDLDITYI